MERMNIGELREIAEQIRTLENKLSLTRER